jgi:ribosomal-protein-alanine N-acetyltransferase
MPEKLDSERLILRLWRDDDVEPFAALNADPQVMEHFPTTMSRVETEQSVERIRAQFLESGFGLWAVELRASGQFLGFVGLHVPVFDAHFTPCVEIGWRLDKPFWGKGYAPEAAAEAMRDGYQRLGLSEIVSMTSTTNLKSMRVMEKLGMTRDPADDFNHPKLPIDHHLCRHVLYRLSADRWRRNMRSGV